MPENGTEIECSRDENVVEKWMSVGDQRRQNEKLVYYEN